MPDKRVLFLYADLESMLRFCKYFLAKIFLILGTNLGKKIWQKHLAKMGNIAQNFEPNTEQCAQ
jgi:hypothetical protein